MLQGPRKRNRVVGERRRVEVVVCRQDLQVLRSQVVHGDHSEVPIGNDDDRAEVAPRRAGDLGGGETFELAALRRPRPLSRAPNWWSRVRPGSSGHARPARAGPPPRVRGRRPRPRSRRPPKGPPVDRSLHDQTADALPRRRRRCRRPRACRRARRSNRMPSPQGPAPRPGGRPRGRRRVRRRRGRRHWPCRWAAVECTRSPAGTPASFATPTVMKAEAVKGKRPAGRYAPTVPTGT